jgi:tetratricopeptide (TPR) repeat protein
MVVLEAGVQVSRIAANLVFALALVAGLGVAAVTLRAGDLSYTPAAAEQRMLYVRSGKVANRLTLSFRPLAADIYWIRTIQHYGRDMRSARTTGRFELLEPLLDLTTTLDPHFNIAYRFGAIFLATAPPAGPGRPDQAVALLEKGIQNNPDRWQYANDAGFVYYFKAAEEYDPDQTSKDYQTAANWFERSAKMPGAPEWLVPIAAITRAQGGDRANARVLLNQLAQSQEDYLRKAALRGLQQIQALDWIDALQDLVERYHDQKGAYPTVWMDMVRAGILRTIPGDPTNAPFILDPDNHLVTLNPHSSLGPLPRIPARK